MKIDFVEVPGVYASFRSDSLGCTYIGLAPVFRITSTFIRWHLHMFFATQMRRGSRNPFYGTGVHQDFGLEPDARSIRRSDPLDWRPIGPGAPTEVGQEPNGIGCRILQVLGRSLNLLGSAERSDCRSAECWIFWVERSSVWDPLVLLYTHILPVRLS